MGVFNLTAMSDNATVQEPKTQPEVATDGPVTVAVKETDESEERMVTLDGPLSRIYTKALNLAYARESIAMMTPDALMVIKSQRVAEIESTYVYAVDTSLMDMAQLVASTEEFRKAIDANSYKTVILALESENGVNSKTQLLAQMGKSLGAKVYYSRDAAVRAVLTCRVGG